MLDLDAVREYILSLEIGQWASYPKDEIDNALDIHEAASFDLWCEDNNILVDTWSGPFTNDIYMRYKKVSKIQVVEIRNHD